MRLFKFCFLLFCVVLTICFAACNISDVENDILPDIENESVSEEPIEEEKLSEYESVNVSEQPTAEQNIQNNSELSTQKEYSWGDPNMSKVYELLKQLEYWDLDNDMLGAYAIGLFDINFDGTPELFALYPGGSMGNSVVKVYDVETGKFIDEFNHSASVPFYVCKDKTSGEYLTVSEGTFKVPYFDFFKWLDCHNKDWELVASFSVEGDMYRCFNKEITKEEYESKYQEFFGNLEIVEGSGLQIISYDSIQANSADELYWEMSRALFSSTQVFVKSSEQKMD